MKRIINGLVVGPEKMYKNHQILIKKSKIEAIIPVDSLLPGEFKNAAVIDARGGLVTPGFIDIHSDYIESMAAPRPGCLIDFNIAIREFERELLCHGITTMYHSLSFYGKKVFPEKTIRTPENTRKFVELIEKTRKEKHLIHHRFHARFEVDSLDRVEEIEEYIREKKIHLLSFMDHTPGQGQYRDMGVFVNTLKGYRNISDTEISTLIHETLTREKLSIKTIKWLTSLSVEQGIAVASHDDDSPEKVKQNKILGMNISEFPITLETAHKARELGMHTVAGAPNVLQGGSHSGNLSAAEAINEQVVDILCSDYYPASMLHSLFILIKQYNLSIPEAFRLVTLNPAKAVNMDDLRGSLVEGKEADILVINNLENGFPIVTRAFVAGEESLTTNYRK